MNCLDKLHLSVEIDTNQLDAAIEKVNQLKALLQEAHELIDSLKN